MITEWNFGNLLHLLCVIKLCAKEGKGHAHQGTYRLQTFGADRRPLHGPDELTVL